MSDETTPQDGKAMSPASVGSQASPTAIVATLRECADDSRKTEGDYYADQFATDAAVFDKAADEIERLLAEVARLRPTDEEREAICQAVTAYDGNDDDEECAKIAATLRGLLDRTK